MNIVLILFYFNFALAKINLNNKVSVNMPKKILLVLAHPDDETMIGGFLAYFKELGIEIQAIYLTNGEGGKNIVETSNDNSSDFVYKSVSKKVLKEIRLKELSKAAKSWGFTKYYLFGMPDIPLRDHNGIPSKNLEDFLNSKTWDQKFILKKLQKILNEYKPDLVFSLNLDELSHAHHKATRYFTQQIICEMVSNNKINDKSISLYAISERTEKPQKKETRSQSFIFNPMRLSKKSNQSFSELAHKATLNYKSQKVSYLSPFIKNEEVFHICGPLIDFKSTFRF